MIGWPELKAVLELKRCRSLRQAQERETEWQRAEERRGQLQQEQRWWERQALELRQRLTVGGPVWKCSLNLYRCQRAMQVQNAIGEEAAAAAGWVQECSEQLSESRRQLARAQAQSDAAAALGAELVARAARRREEQGMGEWLELCGRRDQRGIRPDTGSGGKAP